MSVEVTSLSDHCTPFLLDRSHVRGRVVRLAQVAHTILGRYDYPLPVARMLGELLVAAGMLSSNLKQDGIFTIQIKGKAAVPLVVVDAVYGGALRGYAEVADSAAITETSSFIDILSKGATLTITLDPGKGMQRYQGIVEVGGNSILEALAHYFTQSQQVDMMMQAAVEQVMLPGASTPIWMASGVMIERLPQGQEDPEHWRYARAILATLKPKEMLDPMLDASALLFRLYHEQGVRVFDALPMSVGCRCSRERILALLRSMPMEERSAMLENGPARVHCQFCNKTEAFTSVDLGMAVN